MKEKRNKGFVSRIVYAAIFLTIAIICFIFQQNKNGLNPDKLPTFKGETTQVKNDVVAIDVYRISQKPVATVSSNKTEIWLVDYKYGYIGLQANQGDKTVKELVQKGSSLQQKPQKIAVKFYNTRSHKGKELINNYASVMQNLFKQNKDIQSKLSFYTYVSLSELKSDNRFFMIASLITFVIAILFAVSAFLTRRRVNQAYDTLYQEYPELNGNLDQLLSGNTFHDEELQIVIYKNHLITYYGGFTVEDLRQVVQLYHNVFTTKRNGVITTSRNSSLIAISMQNDIQKKHSLPIKNIGKRTDEQLQNTFYYIHEHFPTIQLGV